MKEKSLDDLKLRGEQIKIAELDNKNKKLLERIELQNIEIKEQNQKIYTLQDQVKLAVYEKDNTIQQIKLECAQEIKQVQDKIKQELINKQKQFDESQRQIQEQMKNSSVGQQKLKIQSQRNLNEIKVLEHRIASLLIENEKIKSQMEKLRIIGEITSKEMQKQELKIQENLREIESWKEKYMKSVEIGEKSNQRTQQEQAKTEGLKEEINRLNEQLESIIEQNNSLEEQLSLAQQESRNLRNQLMEGIRRDNSSASKSNRSDKQKS